MLARFGTAAPNFGPLPLRPTRSVGRPAWRATAVILVECAASTLCGCAHPQTTPRIEVWQPAPSLLAQVRPAQEAQRPSVPVVEQKSKPPRPPSSTPPLSTADKETLFQEFLTWERVRRQKTTVTALDLQHADSGEEARRAAPATPAGGPADAAGRNLPSAPPTGPTTPAGRPSGP
jgi:hypothetical protein